MALVDFSRKRKAITRDSVSSEKAALFDELGNGPLNGVLSDNDSSSEEEIDSADNLEDSEDGYEDSESDEILSVDDAFDGYSKTNGVVSASQLKLDGSANGVHHAGEGEEEEEEDGISQGPIPSLSRDANGNLRFIYQSIDPVYDSDDSDAPETNNTIGNIPLSFYDAYPHIGYDTDGKRIMRPATGAALDTLLESIEIPKGWTGLTDPSTGKPLELSEEELDVLKRLTRNEVPEDGYDPYPDTIEYFTSKTEQMPLSAAPEPKRRFVPSKHEAVRVMKIVKAIREGRILPYRPPEEREEDDDETINYDIWQDEAPRTNNHFNLTAPKLPPPGYDESYHPPPEYVPDEKERTAWQEADEEDREKEYLPSNYDALRKVPGYAKFVKERFERSLDLYLAPRVRRSKLNIDPESLLPKLPSPEELRPFPTRHDCVYSGHEGRVRCTAFDPRGEFLCTGGDDGMVCIWSAFCPRLLWKVRLSDQNAVDAVSWRPTKDALILAAAAGDSIFLIAPSLETNYYPDMVDETQTSRDLLNAGWMTPDPAATNNGTLTKESPAKWNRPELRLQERGVIVQITVRSNVKDLAWHRRGDYFSSVAPRGQTSAVAIHTLSKHLTQLPFRKLKGLAQSVQFHPSKPVFFVATQRMIRSYDLAKQELLKILQPGARWISSFDVHPGGDNLIVGSFDKRLLWMDIDLSVRPYKTLRYHGKAIRSVKFHQGGYPLFADASDDGSLQIFHGRVVNDLMENANIVPLKVLKGHEVQSGLGVLSISWHPKLPWMVSAGADGTCRLWKP